MATRLRPGHRTWSVSRDTEGHREYKVTLLVESDTPRDGPAIVLQTTGIPTTGSTWLVDNDVDLWATCKINNEVKPLVTNEPNYLWEVTCTFSTKGDTKKCKDQQIDDPLLQAPKISGSFAKDKREATQDRNGYPIINSAFEQFRGPQVEFDENHMTVKVEQNVPILQLDLLASMTNRVNDAPLWGMDRRQIRLSQCSWERKFYGLCYVYYTRTLEFELRSETFDRALLDEGSKVIMGDWSKDRPLRWVVKQIDGKPADPNNPQHFQRYKDPNGENTRVILNGRGYPAGVPNGQGATADIVIDFFGKVASITVTTQGSGYITPPTVSIIDVEGGGSGATATAVVTNGRVASITIGSRGSNYTAATKVVIQPTTSSPGSILVAKYDEANFLLLGLPLTF